MRERRGNEWGVFQGSLFSSDFLQESITGLPGWSHFDDAAIEALSLGSPAHLRPVSDRGVPERKPD